MSLLKSEYGPLTSPNAPDERVPMIALAPLIERWSKENTVSTAGNEERGWYTGAARSEGSGWLEHLSRLSGVGTRHIRRIVRGGYDDHRAGYFIDWVSFDTADKLTSAMDCNEEWTEGGSLNPWYGPLRVKRNERHLAGVE